MAPHHLDLIMPWKDGYTITDEVSPEQVEWPDSSRCAFTLVVDCSVVSGPEGITEADMDTHEAQFGFDVGVPRLLELFETYGIKVTFAMPAVIAAARPEMARAIVTHGHEIAAHGYAHEALDEMPAPEEERRLDETLGVLESASGQRPVGWYALPRQGDRYPGGLISANTVNFLIDRGLEYLGNSMADDIPHYWVTNFDRRRTLLAMPYYYHFNDLFFLMFPAPGGGTGLENPRALRNNWMLEFDAAYRFGRLFPMVVHPYLIGWGHRLEVLTEALRHSRELPQVWNATAAECARYWKGRYPADTFLGLEPSIWRDYPGSLS